MACANDSGQDLLKSLKTMEEFANVAANPDDFYRMLKHAFYLLCDKHTHFTIEMDYWFQKNFRFIVIKNLKC